MLGFIGEKLGMMQIFDTAGKWIPVTVIKVGPCPVIQKKTVQAESYSSVQVGFGPIKEKNLSRAALGHFKKNNSTPVRIVREFRTKNPDLFTSGELLDLSLVESGDTIDVSGVSKGKGFQGVMKRHNFSGGMATHGCSVSHRAAGSIGQRTWPGKVFKGKRMAGQMGNKNTTVKNLKVVAVEKDQNLLLVKGAIPGSNHSFVSIKPVSFSVEERFAKGKNQA